MFTLKAVNLLVFDRTRWSRLIQDLSVHLRSNEANVKRPNLETSSYLSYQHLEERKLMAGDVSVVENGHLFIRGDELSNQFEIVADDSGKLTVTGLRGTTINGSHEPFQVNDVNELQGERGRNASFDGGLRIMTFGGNDRIDIRGIEIGDNSRIVTGAGNDFVRLIRSTSDHDFFVATDSGDDTFKFVQSRSRGDLNVKTGHGHDAIRFRNSRTWGNTNLLSGTGDDAVTLKRVRFTGTQQYVLTHDGDDRVRVRDNDVNDSGLKIFAGNGRDHVFAEMKNANDVTGTILVAGQAGFDVLDLAVEEAMVEMIQHHGFVDGKSVDSQWMVFDRADTVSGANFNYLATTVQYEETTDVDSIDWVGSYFSSEAPDTDDFVIEIFESESIISVGHDFWYQQPSGEAVARFEVGNEVDRVDTGQQWLDSTDQRESADFDRDDDGFLRGIYSYSAEIDFQFLADKTYWVSIYRVTVEDVSPVYNSSDYDFGILIEYPGVPGQVYQYEQPVGSQLEPYDNQNASLFDHNGEFGDPTRWSFATPNFRAAFTLT